MGVFYNQSFYTYRGKKLKNKISLLGGDQVMPEAKVTAHEAVLCMFYTKNVSTAKSLPFVMTSSEL